MQSKIDSLETELAIMRTVANELRGGATYWQGRALQAEAKSEARRVALEIVAAFQRWHDIPSDIKDRVAHALSDDVEDTESMATEVK